MLQGVSSTVFPFEPYHSSANQEQLETVTRARSRLTNKERWYHMRSANEFQQQEIASEKMSLTTSAEIKEEGLFNALIDEEQGVLRPGAMPKLHAASAGGCKKLLDAMGTKAHWPQPSYNMFPNYV